MTSKYERSYKKDQTELKKNLIVFDLDGCIADSDDYVVTNKEAYKLEPELFDKKPSKDEENNFSLAYFKAHQKDIKPYSGIFQMFVRLANVENVAIVTSRFDVVKQQTIEWLKYYCTQYFDETTWRRMQFQISFNEKKEKSLVYKARILKELMEKHNIILMVEDHPEVIDWAKSKGIMVLIPSTGYKDLEGTDRTK